MHYASLDQDTSVFGVKDSYLQDDADFHTIVAKMADIPRSQAKTINLGLFYGMGKAKLQAELGVSKDKAEELFTIYHERVPFVKTLMNSVSNRAQQRGQISTLLGRLCRFICGSQINLVYIKHYHLNKHARNMEQASSVGLHIQSFK